MLFLLPPSETKTRPAGGSPLELESLAVPELGPERATMLRAVLHTAAAADAQTALGVPASAAHLVERMQRIDQ